MHGFLQIDPCSNRHRSKYDWLYKELCEVPKWQVNSIHKKEEGLEKRDASKLLLFFTVYNVMI